MTPGLRRAGRRRARAAAALAVAALLASCHDSPSEPREAAPGYDPHGTLTDGGQQRRFIYHWPRGATVHVYVDPTAAPDGSDLRAAVVDAAAAWTATLRGGEVAVAPVSDPAQAEVIVHYGEAPRLVGSGDCAPPSVGAAGVTFTCPDLAAGTFQLLPLLAGGPGRVKMDVAVYRGRAATEAQFRRVVAHELGHVLGIGAHSTVMADLMYPAPAVDAPSAADGQTLRWVLQQSSDLRL